MSVIYPDDWQALRAACYARGYALGRELEPVDGYAVWEVEPDARGAEKYGYWRKDGGERYVFADDAALRSWLAGLRRAKVTQLPLWDERRAA